MTNPNDPIHTTLIDFHPTGHLTKREYLAAMAMGGLVAGSRGLSITVEQFAEQSVRRADALIIELRK